ncbi:MAG: ParB/RepB/Spo0J family partition protein [Christensenellaceae bacterium]
MLSQKSIQELADSIRQIGLLQPINVRRCGDGKYELIAGERRLRACKLAGLSYVKALITSTLSDQELASIAMIENLQRENLHFFEEAEGYQSLLREHGFTQEELAKKLSKNQSTIANKLRILKLTRNVKDKILTTGLSERHARALLRLHNEKAQLELVDKIAGEGLSVKATEDLVEKELKKLYGEEPKPQRGAFRIKCSDAVYINTLKKSLAKIHALGVNTDLCYEQKDGYLEVVIRIEK